MTVRSIWARIVLMLRGERRHAPRDAEAKDIQMRHAALERRLQRLTTTEAIRRDAHRAQRRLGR